MQGWDVAWLLECLSSMSELWGPSPALQQSKTKKEIPHLGPVDGIAYSVQVIFKRGMSFAEATSSEGLS